ncbi:MAG: DNA-binding FadR family transcriptional regulator [Psychromonas sp.]|jgi:DNA-binding FadR family transcriptional regulator
MFSTFTAISGSNQRRHVQVASSIAHRILSGDLTPGSLLPGEMVLSVQMGISRTALREAVKLLNSKGLLRSKSKTGTIVTEKSNWNYLDPQLLEWMNTVNHSEIFYQQFLTLRKTIEPDASALAAKNATPEQRIEFSEIFEKMENIANDFDHISWAEGDMRFHRLIYLSTGNDFYLPFGNVLATIYKSFSTYNEKDNGTGIEEHRAIYTAIMAGDQIKAREATKFLFMKEKYRLPSEI